MECYNLLISIKLKMESPFDTYSNKTTVLYLEPIYDPYQQIYINAITLSGNSDGPLSAMVKQVNSPPLSPFQTFSNSLTSPFPNCAYVLNRYPIKSGYSSVNKNILNWMTGDDIPKVLSYLKANQYEIDTSLTSMLNHSQVNLGGVSDSRFSGNRKFICIFTYMG